MFRFRSIVLFMLATCCQPLFSQHLTDARSLHVTDTGVLTAGALDASGNLYVASTANLKTLPGENGIGGLFLAGDPVLSKYAADGTLIWRHEFPDNYVRICDVAVLPDQSLVITGGYVDTLRLAPGWLLPGDHDNGNFFVARLDAEGHILWIDTDVSTLPEDCMGWKLAIADGAIYVTGLHEAIYASLRRYDFAGHLQREKIVDIRSISDLKPDGLGGLYAAGTAATGSLFNNLPVPEPPLMSGGYTNYLVRLDSNFKAQWIRTNNYFTFDWHPKVAVFGGQPFFLSNDFDHETAEENGYHLKAYTPEGEAVWNDFLATGSLFTNYLHVALAPVCDHLLLEYPAEGGMAVKSYAADLSDSLLIQTSFGAFDGSFPFICANADRAYFGSNFYGPQLIINDNFTLINDQVSDYQQFILQFECADVSGSKAPVSSSTAWKLAPNPAGSTVYLTRNDDATQLASVQLFDAQGRLCWQGACGTAQAAIPLEMLPAGPYFLKITEVGKVVILRGMHW